jgi:hypothetical protein
MWNPAETMPYGEDSRVEVRIAVSEGLDEELRAGLKGAGDPRFEDLSVSSFMGVTLRGKDFEIRSLSDDDQPVPGAGYATWEFDVRPKRGGTLTLQLCVSVRIPIPGRPDERRSVPVLERAVRVHVGQTARVLQFVGRNWQWMLVSLAGLGTAIAGWKGVF